MGGGADYLGCHPGRVIGSFMIYKGMDDWASIAIAGQPAGELDYYRF